MSTYNKTCSNCNPKLIIADGDSYAGGLRDHEIIFCSKCGNELTPVYTSGIPHVYFDTTSDNK